MDMLIPVWIIGGPFVGLLILAFAFKGPSSMGGTVPRAAPRDRGGSRDTSASILEPTHANAPRRYV